MSVGKGKASRYNRRIQIEQPIADTSLDGAGAGSWAPLGKPIWASVVDKPLMRAEEQLADGINVAARPARVRMRFRTDVTAAMRIVILGPLPRITQIVAGPAEIGFRDEIEFMVEDYSTAGNAA